MTIERLRLNHATSFGSRTPTSTDPVAFIDVGIDQTEADRDGTGNLNCLLLYPNYEFSVAGDGPATGNNYGIRLIPTVSGDADPFTTYVIDAHGFWRNSSGAGSMIALTGEVEVMDDATGGNGGAMVGVVGEVVLRHTTGTFDRIDNLRAHSTHTAAGAVDECHGINVVHEQNAGSTNQYFGLKVTPIIAGTGAITTAYGVYVNIPLVGITTPWAFFAASTARSFFGGQVLMDNGLDLTGGTAGVLGYRTADDGVFLRGKAGATYDLTLVAEDGSYIARVPTGTNTLQLVGALTLDSGANPVSYGANDSGGSGFRVMRVPNA